MTAVFFMIGLFVAILFLQWKTAEMKAEIFEIRWRQEMESHNITIMALMERLDEEDRKRVENWLASRMDEVDNNRLREMKDQIWTEEENQARQLDNMLNRGKKNCKSCHWSGYKKGDEFITCGHHYENFTPQSFCSYWTDPNDHNLIAYDKRIKDRLIKKMQGLSIFKK